MMGQRHYVGWFHRETLAHCNTVDGYGLCEVRRAWVYNESGEDWVRYGKTAAEMLSEGWKLCPRCYVRRNRPLIAEAEKAVLAARGTKEER